METVGTLIDSEVPMPAMPGFGYESQEDVRPRCPGCDRPLTWIDEMNPRCACGMPLFFPVPEPERI